MEGLVRKRGAEEEVAGDVMAAKISDTHVNGGGGEGVAEHPYDYHVFGPRNLSSPNWRDLIRSSWRDSNYRRMVMACFIQAVYMLELDRQDKRTEENGIAPKWWKPFKYKLSQTLVDERDGSIYGGILEWDRSAALSDFILMRPSGAPKAVLALRGTLLRSPTVRRDLEDDLRFLALESLKGSVRFNGVLVTLKEAVEKFGSSNVWIGGHSLGAGFALQVGKALAKEGLFVECHLFNPPSVSVAMSLKSLSEKAGYVWKRIRGVSPSNGDLVLQEDDVKPSQTGRERSYSEMKKWMPNLYINSSDYICCYYTNPASSSVAPYEGKDSNKGMREVAAAKLFVLSKGPKKFLEAHGMQQWWSDDMELQLAVHESQLINRQLRSLYRRSPAMS